MSNQTDQYARLDRHDESRQKEHADRSMFLVTLASTLIAVFAAAAAFWASWEAHKLRVEDQRPFLTMDFDQPTNNTTPAILTNILKNTGKSPARNIKSFCRTAIDTEQAVAWLMPAQPNNTFPFLFPGHWVLPRCSVSHEDASPTINATIVDLGVITYEDTEGRKYQSPFCYQWQYTATQTANVFQCTTERGLPEVK